MLQRMRRHIRGGRYEFVFAGNGVEALQKLNEDETIDMVLSDINMPQMDGLTLLDQIPNVSPRHTRRHHLGVRRHAEHPHRDEPRGLRLRHQARRLRGPASHHRPDAAASRRVAGGGPVPRQARRIGKRARHRQQDSAVDPPRAVPHGPRFSDLRQHGAGAGSGRRFLRCDPVWTAGRWALPSPTCPARAFPRPSS